jgi:hypothetical protein
MRLAVLGIAALMILAIFAGGAYMVVRTMGF